ncbi:MAG: hypothetical protein HETSPECPRED_003233 [Heterodermia speciosa]|uniref:Cyclochlorotine biosynthesis protein O n=1 Tax=Heterodermia speciosa TaxID=116794 RepID=A0A8H3J660_9LECA|nr:MAG: hypothetical protein HETSPECPRED_003233 [Heterodermia speciosa]
MKFEKRFGYLPLQKSSAGEAFVSDTDNTNWCERSGSRDRFARSSNSLRAAALWLLQAILFSLSVTVLVVSRKQHHSSAMDCVFRLSQYSPGLEALSDDYQTVRFKGSFSFPSPYKGPPTPEVDKKWNEIENMGAIKISAEEFSRLNASRHAVRVPSSLGGGYMALPEFVHQIHCVKMFWAHTYPDYYVEAYNRSLENPEEWHQHMDHCADLLRQKLMCDADMTLITYNWISNHYQPHPNFNVQHKCRNFESAKEWTFRRRIDASSLKHHYFTRPEEETVVDFKEPPFDPQADA